MKTLQMIAGLVAAQQRFDTNLLRLTTIAAADETVTIGDYTATAVDADAGDNEFLVGSDADDSAENLADLINAEDTQDITATYLSGIGVLIESNRAGARALACTTTLAGANNGWAAAATYGGTTQDLDGNLRKFDCVAVTPNAVEIALGRIDVKFGFEPGAVIVNVRDTNGDPKAWDGATAIDGALVTLDNSGSTDLLATDTVTILAFEA